MTREEREKAVALINGILIVEKKELFDALKLAIEALSKLKKADMTREERENVLHCLKAINDEEVCEECNLYGTTGTDHCQYDMVKLAIEALSEPTKTEPTTLTENMINGEVLTMIFPDITESARENEYYLDKDGDNLTYIHIDGDWISKPYKGNFTTPTRPKAKWIKVDEHLYECSCCGYNYRNYDGQVMKFCMNCGAVMEGGE